MRGIERPGSCAIHSRTLMGATSWAALLIAACRTATEATSLVCPSHLDYVPISGCAAISARLLGQRDQPLWGAYYVVDIPGSGQVKSPDFDGYVQLEILRSAPRLSADGPDTARVTVTYLRRSDQVLTPPVYMDSTRVLVTFALPGQRPIPAQAILRLPVP